MEIKQELEKKNELKTRNTDKTIQDRTYSLTEMANCTFNLKLNLSKCIYL